MYLNAVEGMKVQLGERWLTVTLDVFKCFLFFTF